MMKDEEKTKGHLIKELAELRGIIAETSKALLSDQDQNHEQKLYASIQKKLPA